MATSSSTVIEAFLLRVETDRKFFNYRDVDEDQGLEVAKFRAKNFLVEACGRIMLEGMPSVNFTPVMLEEDVETEEENEDGETVTTVTTVTYLGWDFDLTAGEIYLLASMMYEQYMERDIATLKTMNVNFTGTELRVFDPSNARKTFLTMYEEVKSRNAYLLDVYKNSDRLTGYYSTIDFDSLDFDVGDYYGD